MSIEEFLAMQNSIVIGEEISLTYKNESYWISQNPGKCYLTRVRESYTQEFDNPTELFEKAIIDGKRFSTMYSELD